MLLIGGYFMYLMCCVVSLFDPSLEMLATYWRDSKSLGVYGLELYDEMNGLL